MESRLREKIALLVLMFLVISFVSVGVFYVSHAGKTWNLAASVVDDTFGSMDGYAVIAYGGTVVTEKDPVFAPSESDESVDAADAEGADQTSDIVGGQDVADDADESLLAEESQTTSDEIQTSVSNKFLPIMELEIELEPLYVSDVRAEYESKGASVLSLDTRNADRYSTPGYFYVGDKVIGVFEVSSPLPATRMAAYSEYFASKNVDVVLAVSPRRAYLETLEGVDIVLVTSAEEGYTTIGSNESGTFVVRAPEVGSVGVILITSSNVVSSKVISELS